MKRKVKMNKIKKMRANLPHLPLYRIGVALKGGRFALNLPQPATKRWQVC